MCTGRCSGRLWGRGVCLGGVCLPRRESAWGVSGRRPLPLWTEWQKGVKTLPCRNYVADGKNANDMDYTSGHNIELQYVVNVSRGQKYRSVTEESYFDTKLPL